MATYLGLLLHTFTFHPTQHLFMFVLFPGNCLAQRMAVFGQWSSYSSHWNIRWSRDSATRRVFVHPSIYGIFITSSTQPGILFCEEWKSYFPSHWIERASRKSLRTTADQWNANAGGLATATANPLGRRGTSHKSSASGGTLVSHVDFQPTCPGRFICDESLRLASAGSSTRRSPHRVPGDRWRQGTKTTEWIKSQAEGTNN